MHSHPPSNKPVWISKDCLFIKDHNRKGFILNEPWRKAFSSTPMGGILSPHSHTDQGICLPSLPVAQTPRGKGRPMALTPSGTQVPREETGNHNVLSSSPSYQACSPEGKHGLWAPCSVLCCLYSVQEEVTATRRVSLWSNHLFPDWDSNIYRV